jgi:phage shock protein PspC (stress-responsive transcriptional regulator)
MEAAINRILAPVNAVLEQLIQIAGPAAFMLVAVYIVLAFVLPSVRSRLGWERLSLRRLQGQFRL